MADSRKTLISAHVVLLLVVIGVIALLHTKAPPFLDFLRMPLFLRAVDPLVGSVYPGSFYVYHITLNFLWVFALLNLASFALPKSRFFRSLSLAFSLVGVVIMTTLCFFFLYTLNLHAGDQLVQRGSVAYLAFCSILLLLSFHVFLTHEKALKNNS